MDIHKQIAEAILARAAYIVFNCALDVADAREVVWLQEMDRRYWAAMTQPSPFMKLIDGKN